MKKAFIVTFILLIFIASCAKKQNIPLAKNYYEQSLLESEEKNYKKALQLIDKSIELSPAPQAFALKATLLYQIKEFQESLSVFKKIISDKKTPPVLKTDVMNNYACALLAMNKKKEAKQIWIQLVKNKNYLSPEAAWFNLGLLELSNSTNRKILRSPQSKILLKNAERYFNKAISIASQYVDAYFYLAITLIKLKENNKAKKVIKQLLKISPNHAAAKNLLEEI